MRMLVPSSTLIALAMLTTPNLATAQNAPFCLKSVSGATNCIYQSMAQCEQIKIPNSADQCLSAAQAGGTVGQGNQPPPTQMPDTQRQPGSQVPGGGLPPAER